MKIKVLFICIFLLLFLVSGSFLNKTVHASNVMVSGTDIIEYARSWVGKTPYVYGGTNLNSGADCSGFVLRIFQHFQIDLSGFRNGTKKYNDYPDFAERLDYECQALKNNRDVSGLVEGDLLYFFWDPSENGCSGGKCGHVGIYSGNGYMIHNTGNYFLRDEGKNDPYLHGAIETPLTTYAPKGSTAYWKTDHAMSAQEFRDHLSYIIRLKDINQNITTSTRGIYVGNATVNLREKPYQDSNSTGMLTRGTNYLVPRSITNDYGNLWHYVCDMNGNFLGWEYNSYLDRIDDIKSQISIQLYEQPYDQSLADIKQNGFTVKGMITSAFPVTNVRVQFKDAGTGAVLTYPAPQDVSIGGLTSFDLTEVDKKAWFGRLGVGTWQMELIATDTMGGTASNLSRAFRVYENGSGPDTSKPVVTDVTIDSISSSGFDLLVSATDNVGVTRIKVETWNDVNGESSAGVKTVNYTGANMRIHIDASSAGGAVNTYFHSKVSAEDAAGNVSEIWYAGYDEDIFIDTLPPILVTANISGVTNWDYMVYCKFTDSSPISQIVIGSWHDNMSIDDAVWQATDRGEINGHNEATFSVNIEDFGGAQNVTYHTNVYAIDQCGNQSNVIRAGDVYISGAGNFGTLRLDSEYGNQFHEEIMGTVNVYIDKVLVASEVNDYVGSFPFGTEYEIELVSVDHLKYFDGTKGYGMKGTIENENCTVTMCFSEGLFWATSDTLPNGVTPEVYDIEYNNSYRTISASSPGNGWVQGGIARTETQAVGSVYSSDVELETSASRRLVSYYYYHYCGGSHGKYSDHTIRRGYVHWDVITDTSSVYEVSVHDDDTDAGYKYYVLRWNNGNYAYCKSGVTCDGSNGTHGERSYYWYKMYHYQDYQTVTYYYWTKEAGWTSQPDPSALSTRVRYIRKYVPVESITLDAELIETDLSRGSISLLPTINPANATNKEVHWYSSNIMTALADQDGTITFFDPGAVIITCATEDREVSASVLLIIHDDEKFIVPKNTKNIGAYAFRQNSSIREIVLPEGLETIGSYAFENCSNLGLITAPGMNTQIGADAFAGFSGQVICSEGSSIANYFSQTDSSVNWYDLSHYK